MLNIMSSTFRKKLLPEFDSIKDDDEEILWTNNPRFIPCIITRLSLGVGLFVFVGIYYAMTKESKNSDLLKMVTNRKKQSMLCLILIYEAFYY